MKKNESIDIFYKISEQKLADKKKLPLNEIGAIDAQIGPDVNISIKPIGKWGALVGINAAACWTALNIAALNAGAITGTAFFLSTSVVPIMLAGAFGYLYFKTKLKNILPDWVSNVFSIFRRKKKKDPLGEAQKLIRDSIKNIMVDTGLSKDDSTKIMELVNGEIHENEECRSLTEKLLKAIVDNDAIKTNELTDKLDNAVMRVYESLIQELEKMIKEPEEGEAGEEIEEPEEEGEEPLNESKLYNRWKLIAGIKQ